MRDVGSAGRLRPRAFGLLLALITMVGVSVVAAAVPAVAGGSPGGAVTYFTDASITHPISITFGPDGAFWFVNQNGSTHGTIGRITPTGIVTNYPDPKLSYPQDITTGPDGALWFTEDVGAVGRITTGGVVTTYPDPGLTDLDTPTGIVAGSDGALWVSVTGSTPAIQRITTAGVVTSFDKDGDLPTSIAAGSDGALWFTDGTSSIGRITTGGVVSRYTDPSVNEPIRIAAGSDGALWFTNAFGGPSDIGSIGRITTKGAITDYTDPSIAEPDDIAAGPDGALWFTNTEASVVPPSVGRITTSGVVTNYTDPNGPIAAFGGMAAGPDGAVWFTRTYASPGSGIGRITTPSFAHVWPKSGPAGSAANVSGGGFSPGESVSASYKTGLTTPKSVAMCTATAAANGTFSCNGTIPATDAGAPGGHAVTVKGASSLTTASATFKLTTLGVVAPHISYKSTFNGAQEVIAVTGSGFAPFSGDTVDVYDPVAAGYQHAFPTASTLGTFTVDVPIPEYACRAAVTIDAAQASPISATANVLTDPAYCSSFAAITLRNGWTNASFGNGDAAAALISGVVYLRGAIATAGTNPIPFTLPVNLRPAAEAYVPVDMCNGTNGRLDIAPSGVVTVQAETAFSNAQCFTSLDGVSYALSATKTLTLTNGWTTASGTAAPKARITSGIVHLMGAIASGSNAPAFTLPAAYRPATAVYVPVDMCNATNGRLVIEPNGQVTPQAESAFSNAQCLTSLDGASFALTAPTALTLQNGWTNAPFATADAAATMIAGVVHLKGAIATAGSNPVAFTLPANLRPAVVVYVAVDLCAGANGRLIIDPSGVVTVQAETAFSDAQCFTALDGVSFAP